MQVISGIIFPSTTQEALAWYKKRYPSKRQTRISAVRHLAEHMAFTLKQEATFCRSKKEVENPFADSGNDALIEAFTERFTNVYEVKLY